jgi:alkylation response protein AidB-like acyl-CoA dehydrogenase
MIHAAFGDFAANALPPAAADSDAQCSPPEKLLFKAASELGITFAGVPETLGGAGSERSAITNVLVAEALAHGDMGLAVATLAPAAVSTSLVLWGDESQQANYLPSFVGEDVPTAALAIIEPHALFDAFSLETMARQQGGGYVLDGVKSLVPGAARAELFVIAAELEGTSRLFIVESSSNGLSIEAEPAMGLRAAATGRLRLDSVAVPARALLGTGDDYADCVRLSRLGWAALAVGTSQAVLDYVIPYVNERIAFGEPVSNRQSVAFMVANIGIELEGIRLATYRAASRAEQGKSFARETAVARRLAGEYGMQIGSNGVQLLGGHGFVKEHPVERWYRDLRAVAIMEGVVLV